MRPRKNTTIWVYVILAISLTLVTIAIFKNDTSRQYAPVVPCQVGLHRTHADILLYHNLHDVLPNCLNDLSTLDPHGRPYICRPSGNDYIIVPGISYDMPKGTLIAYCPEKHRLLNERGEGQSRDWGVCVTLLHGTTRPIPLGEAKRMFIEQRVDWVFEE